MKMMEQLKPCPFCNGERHVYYSDSQKEYFAVHNDTKSKCFFRLAKIIQDTENRRAENEDI